MRANAQPDRKFWYLDLHPERVQAEGRSYTRASLLRWGTPRCFCQRDLYTTQFGSWISTDIERLFFGQIDQAGRKAIEYLAGFQHPSVNSSAVQDALLYMSLQKLRTPKGLKALGEQTRLTSPNAVLIQMQRLQTLYGAVWSEAVWCLLDASASPTKFLLSDHPVTAYNCACPPASTECRGHRDPDVRLAGTHTLFPLSSERLLVLTNLTWARDPYDSPLRLRQNPDYFRNTMFNFLQIQTGRELTEIEVCEINYIIKLRAHRFIAARDKEWLYPEEQLRTLQWSRLGGGYLLFPDPRSMTFSSEIMMKFSDGRHDAVDEYGRRPGHPDFSSPADHEREWGTSLAFRGEFARMFGPVRRGRAYDLGGLDAASDDDDYHRHNLSLEAKYKPKPHSLIKRSKPPN